MQTDVLRAIQWECNGNQWVAPKPPAVLTLGVVDADYVTYLMTVAVGRFYIFFTTKQQTPKMSFSTTSSFTTQAPTLFGRGGYNGPAKDEDEDSFSMSAPLNFGRGGYNRGDDDDDEEDGRGGYN
ncbi:hypothetical protein D0Z07_5333 [Hyphodiscus hymeniophilus]|uniref:Uncharacterized protein n=1 Tax=Hyphodiscus hymeniophilus TaxID=353542 RepID=A0A9P7AWE0_9HELO|nr:hypothetical protein D0Z07_5333 [Hyphodiscus hymeniophilus]